MHSTTRMSSAHLAAAIHSAGETDRRSVSSCSVTQLSDGGHTRRQSTASKPRRMSLTEDFWQGVLHLIVLAPKPSSRAYGIELPCDIYYGIEEMLHSVAVHGFESGSYRGGSIYIKEAESSALLSTYSTLLKDYQRIDSAKHTPRHFLFVGADLCYQALGISEPIVRTFSSHEEAYPWSAGHD
jgi:hypothetical protein